MRGSARRRDGSLLVSHPHRWRCRTKSLQRGFGNSPRLRLRIPLSNPESSGTRAGRRLRARMQFQTLGVPPGTVCRSQRVRLQFIVTRANLTGWPPRSLGSLVWPFGPTATRGSPLAVARRDLRTLVIEPLAGTRGFGLTATRQSWQEPALRRRRGGRCPHGASHTDRAALARPRRAPRCCTRQARSRQ